MSSSENPVKIQNKINELNSGKATPEWFPIPGYFALTGFDFNKEKVGNGLPIFNPTFGYPLKAFWNSSTGEIKIFNARLFEN